MAHAQRRIREELFEANLPAKDVFPASRRPYPSQAISADVLAEYRRWKKRKSARWAITWMSAVAIPLAAGLAAGHPLAGAFVAAFFVGAVGLIAFGCAALDNSL
jgi:hypothetical protein